MSDQLPLTETDLNIVSRFADQVVAGGFLAASSAEIEMIRRLVHDYRAHQRGISERLAYLKQSGLGYFTDEILFAARQLSEEIVIHARDEVKTWARALRLAHIVLGDRVALALAQTEDKP